MTLSHANYCEISARAMQFDVRLLESNSKKQEILDSIAEYHGKQPKSVLFMGFSSLLPACTAADITVAGLGASVKNWLSSLPVKYNYIDELELIDGKKKYDWVIAADEFFTFADSEYDQRIGVEQLIKLANTAVITTLRDYKNQDFKDREFSYPLSLRNNADRLTFLESHEHDHVNKNSWKTMVYEIKNDQLTVNGAYNRQSMFFKQLARLSLDAGARSFYVHKNLMYKSVIKKNYEHIISIAV
jgi:hypothetical protein